MDVHLDDSHRQPLDLAEVTAEPTPPMVDLEDHIDRIDPRPVEWRVRSSWSATALRQRLDDAPTAVPQLQATSEPEPPGGSALELAPPGADEPREQSVHAKHARSFAALPDQIGRYGTRIGRAVHGVLQSVDLHDPRRDLGRLVTLQCEAEEVPERFQPYAARLVESVLASEVFTRMREAAQQGTVRREMYVGAEVTSDAGPIGIYGIIDAIWMGPDGYVVVDYKTDHVLEPPEVLIDRYQVQLQAYERALVAASGRPVAELLLCVALPDGSPAATIPIPSSAALGQISG
jgi:ATP-dependent exoDNAse (exonuclease V) beta subunit